MFNTPESARVLISYDTVHQVQQTQGGYMNRIILVAVALLFVCSIGTAQIIADFEKDMNGFVNNNWGAGMPNVTQVADPTGKSAGVLQLGMNFAKKTNGAAAVGSPITVPVGAKFITYWVYLPANIPNGIQIGVFAQDNKNWVWNEGITDVKDIPKAKWYPLSFGLAAAYINNPNFDIVAGKLATGLQIANWNAVGADTIWAGNILVDNVGFLSEAVGDKWVIADFGAEAGGTQTITIPNFTPVSTAIAWNSFNGGTLKMTLDFAQGAGGGNQGKAGLLKNSVKIWNDTTKALIDGISMDVFFPADFPAGSSVDIVYQPQNKGYPWMSTTYSISDTTIKKNQWQTLLWNPANFLTTINDSTQVDKKGLGNFVIQIYNASEILYKGVVYFDNLTLRGIKAPTSVVTSPAIATKTDTVKTKTNTVVDFVQFNWVDNTAGDETYNIYTSKSPITSLTGAGVVLLHPGVPHGLQKYGHRPWTSNGSVVDLYYAITASQGGLEKPLGTGSASGKVSVKSSTTLKVKYVKDFATKFQLDGLDDEFVAYKANQIIPEHAGDSAAVSWTPASTDCYFKTTLIIDDKYLYVSADITDDEVNTNSSYQSWQGDAIEFYIGYYDTRPMTKLHGKNFSNTNGDWRIGFNSLGSTTLDGGSATTVPGVESTVFVKLSGDGYIAEARLALDSLAAGKSFGKVTNGMLFPFKLDCNDIDPSKGDVGRTLILQTAGNTFGSKVDMDQDWTRPHAWGLLEVVDGPTDVAQNDNGLPTEYRLYNSYPNPFNPSTTIKYDLKAETNVSLKVFNAVGQEVTTLVRARQSAGRYSIVFNAKALSSGVYFYRLEAGPYVKVQKMLLLK
jgi:hypothetical protein